jgi:transcriptional regulator with XRE-family HTH domain
VQEKKMLTLSEFLKEQENQVVVLDKMIQLLRDCGKWGKHGLFTEISGKIGFSPAYIGQVLTGKKAISEKFVEEMAGYFGESIECFRGESATKQEKLNEQILAIMNKHMDDLINMNGTVEEKLAAMENMQKNINDDIEKLTGKKAGKAKFILENSGNK